ncbi:hypothetical protein BDR26DRAFT_937931 [Obelidium mucronatum]|nr:hypothetical protein BDR26DRAFT_937931 [Obelidium mucronatum]
MLSPVFDNRVDANSSSFENVGTTSRPFFGNQHKPVPSDSELRPLIESYFWKGRSNDEIVMYMKDYHGFNVSKATIKRRLAAWGLKRSTAEYKHVGEDVQEAKVISAIVEELQGENQRLGYREMTRVLREKHQIMAKEDHVSMLLKEIDPNGVADRKKHKLGRRYAWSVGPNERWAFDGHDKLKKYFLAIHVAILSVFPMSTGSDFGTETVDVAAMQAAFHEIHETGFNIESVHRFVPSTRNTKIESAWTRWLRSKGYLLAEILEAGFNQTELFDETDEMDKIIFLYIWIPVVQELLDSYAEHVNHNVSLFISSFFA